MNKKYIFIGVAVIAVVILFLVMVPKKPPIKPVDLDINTVEGPYSKIKIKGDAPRNGIYDPSIEYGPGGTGWLSYSAVFGGEVPFGPRVETHLAKSTDKGKTWQHAGIINEAFDGSFKRSDGKVVEGSWNYEVSSLVYDPDDPGKEWKIFAHHLLFKKDHPKGSPPNDVTSSTIIYRYASNPVGPWSEVTKLFHGKVLPAEYAKDVKIRLNTLHPDLRRCNVYSEPGTAFVRGTLYMSLTCLTTQPDAIFLLASDDHAETWRYVGTLLNRDDAKSFGYVHFEGSSLVTKGDQVFLFASPGNPPYSYYGTFVFEFDDVTKGKLKRNADGRLIAPTYIMPNKSLLSANGAGQSDYDEENTAGGIIFPQIDIKNAPEIFQIFNTEFNIGESP